MFDIPTHSIFFRPITKYGDVDVKRHVAVWFVTQVRMVYYNSKTRTYSVVLNDGKRIYYNTRYWVMEMCANSFRKM